MTHNNIYNKFLIEYDKANVTSSYPSLTEYEAATIFDKAYNALIAQKVTGNNVRRAPFEADIKAISDLQGLVVTQFFDMQNEAPPADNIRVADLPEDFLYYVSAYLYTDRANENSMDLDKSPARTNIRKLVVQIVDHATANRFFNTAHNIPWIKNPVCYIEGNKIYFAYDLISDKYLQNQFTLMYIKQPQKFVKENLFDDTEFELNDTVAEELISLAISFALENVESPRLNTKLNMRGLEA